VDIAGLVKGASQGEGLGNKFLSHIRAVDAVAHVVRCFHDPNVINVLGALNPGEAADIIETELLLADLQQAEKALEKLQGPIRSGDKKAKERAETIESLIKGFKEGRSARSQNVPADIQLEQGFLTGKPVLYVANTDEQGPDPALLSALETRAKTENARVVTLCAKMEAEIVQLPLEERASYYESAGIQEPGTGSVGSGRQRIAGPYLFFYGRSPGNPRVGYPPRNKSRESRRENPHGHRTGLYSRRTVQIRRPGAVGIV
jgi:ribosome-binding ATPase YchF (GTP1/OBG family)